MPGVCDRAPDFLSPSEDQVLRPALGSSVALNCTAWVVSGPHCSLPSVQWLKDGLSLGNGDHYSLHEYSWPYKPRDCGAGLPPGPAGPAAGCPALHQVPSQRAALVPGRVWGGGDERREALRRLRLLQRLPRGPQVRELHPEAAAGAASGLQALPGRPRPPAARWYPGPRPPGGPAPLGPTPEVPPPQSGPAPRGPAPLPIPPEAPPPPPSSAPFPIPSGAPPPLSSSAPFPAHPEPRLHHRAPPHRSGPRAADARPPAEPSADLLVNLSRCRRLIVVLSDAFLSRAWCSHSFREGLCRLLELTRRPIFITFEGQRRDPAHPALRLLRQHRHLVTLLLWRPGSVTPSSEFWKELQLALPRKVHYRPVEGDPQTQLQDDKDPMLILRGRVPEGRALDSEVDPDPEGDLGVRGPVFGEPSGPPHTSGVSLGEGRSSEVDVSDLGSRNYSARTDFYCLVSKDDM
ncbi:single Ig IL-1-related receptor isoform X2 [Piliocolobus tephrosceles]|uniref:single Ig IL-1-related receptor isoform X2 n=1 Tax=Piliocolobus tephrosceles TaxID=591936 RepID=UPI000C2AF9B1|nr:single Ig IL-1-related receptor isoform X2 [Piliocolobus tephrosceles]